MAAPIGFQLNPTYSDLVKVLNQCADGRRPRWLLDANVFSKHPGELFGSSKPVAERTQTHIVLGVIMFGDQRDRPVPGGAVYIQSGHPVPVNDEVTGNEIGYYKFFRLYQSGNSTPWTMKEYYSLSNDSGDIPFAVYALAFRSDAYLKAEALIAKATTLITLT